MSDGASLVNKETPPYKQVISAFGEELRPLLQIIFILLNRKGNCENNDLSVTWFSSFKNAKELTFLSLWMAVLTVVL